MNTLIKTIILGGLAGNCYLIKTRAGFILIDTGGKTKRRKLEKELSVAGCTAENLKLIILTHGDFDHSGNCAYLREKYNAKIAMQPKDEGMIKHADMFYDQKNGNYSVQRMINSLFKIKKFTPDLTIDEGFSLSCYGLNARILYLPGHSKGSIGILTDTGDLFCGDLFTNKKKPEINSIISDEKDMDTSLQKLKRLLIGTIYPGHGKPFPIGSIGV